MYHTAVFLKKNVIITTTTGENTTIEVIDTVRGMAVITTTIIGAVVAKEEIMIIITTGMTDIVTKPLIKFQGTLTGTMAKEVRNTQLHSLLEIVMTNRELATKDRDTTITTEAVMVAITTEMI